MSFLKKIHLYNKYIGKKEYLCSPKKKHEYG